MISPISGARTQAGFTLIEILVVLVVLGLMAGLVVARGPTRSAALDLRAASGELAQVLRGARARAIAGNRGVVFSLDARTRRFGIEGAAARSLPSGMGVSMRGGEAETEIRFSPDGSSSGGRVILGEGDRHVAVAVDWLTGRVSVADAR